MSEESERDNQLKKFFKEIGNVKDDNRSLILLTHGFIELLISTMIDTKFKHGDKINTHNDYTYSIKLLLINEKELIDDELYKVLDWFRKIRNRAAHEPFFNLSEGNFGTIKDFSQKLSPVEKEEGNHLLMLCLRLIQHLWNNYTEIFVPEFESKNG